MDIHTQSWLVLVVQLAVVALTTQAIPLLLTEDVVRIVPLHMLAALHLLVVAVVVETKVFTIHQIIKIVMEIAVQVVALVTFGHHKEVVVTHPDLKHGLVDIVLVH